MGGDLNGKDHAHKGGGQQCHTQRSRPHELQLLPHVAPVHFAYAPPPCRLSCGGDAAAGSGAADSSGDHREERCKHARVASLLACPTSRAICADASEQARDHWAYESAEWQRYQRISSIEICDTRASLHCFKTLYRRWGYSERTLEYAGHDLPAQHERSNGAPEPLWRVHSIHPCQGACGPLTA